MPVKLLFYFAKLGNTMFKIKEIDPVYHRKQTRKSTIIIMAMFVIVGFTTANLAVSYFDEYISNHLVLNFLGAFVGLLIIFWVVSTFFKDADWMKEAMYAFRLKRQLMHIYNVMGRLQDAADKGDIEATKILRFYQLGLEQMHKLDNNSYELMELEGQMRELESKMKEMGIEQSQTEFDVKSVDDYRK
jgi:hypothetical protein